MSQTSTLNQLVRYAYGELSLLERLETEFALEENYLISEEYKELQEAKIALPTVTFSPTSSTLSSILTYSKNNQLKAQA